MKKNLIENPFIIKTFLKTKIRSCGREIVDSHGKKVPKVGSNYTVLAVILTDFVLEKMKIISAKCF